MTLLQNIYPFILAISCVTFLTFLSYTIGKKIIKIGKFALQSNLEEFLLAEAFGLSVIAYSVFLLGLAGGIHLINFVVLYIIILPLLLGPDIKNACIEVKKNITSFKPSSRNERKPLMFKILLFLLIALMAVNLLNALTPPIGRDALKYHLLMPQYYIQTGYVHPEPTNFYSYFPELVEMLYTFGLILSNDYSSHILHFYFGILAMLVIFSFVRRISGAGTALLCALTFYSMPIVSQLSSWAYVDLGLCFFTLLALSFFSYALEKMDSLLVILSASLFGLALGIKYLALISLYAAAILFPIRYLDSEEPSKRLPILRLGICFFIISAIPALPWLLRNVFLTGNPVYPFFYSIFGGPNWDAPRAAMYDIVTHKSYGMGNSPVDFLLLPWRLVVYGADEAPFDGSIGPLYLVITPLILFFRPKHKPTTYVLIYAACFFFVWANLSQQVRFLLPGLGALSMCLYSVFDCEFKRVMVNRYTIRILTIGLLIINSSYPLEQFQRYQPLAFITGKVNREEFLMRHLKNYPPIQYINTHLPSGSKTYMLFVGNIGYYCKRSFIQESVFEDYTFKNVLTSAASAQGIAAWLNKQAVSHLLIDEAMATQYLYPDLGPEHLSIYNGFRDKYMRPVYHFKNLILYRLDYQK